MKALIGTLYSGENEYDECLNAIQSQTYKNYDHVIFKYLPNKEAHITLFNHFLDRSTVYDLLIKVDADMVISSNVLFEKIVKKMYALPQLEVFSIGVLDFFTGQIINGLNTYRSTVKWNFEKDTMFVDIPEISRENYHYDDRELAPAAIHCKNPSPYQAFHYGVHRGLKSLQRIHSSTHWAFVDKTWSNFLMTRDTRIGLAVLGAELVYAGTFKHSDVDYTNPKVKIELEKYKDLESKTIQKKISNLRLHNWGFLPSAWRRKLLKRLRGNLA